MLNKFFIFLLFIIPTSLEASASLLYTIYAKEGRYSNEKLTLQKVSDRVTGFTKGPNRKACVVQLSELIPHLTKEKKLECHLVFHQETHDAFHDIPITLSAPTYTSTTFTAKVLPIPPAQIPSDKPLESVTLLFHLPHADPR